MMKFKIKNIKKRNLHQYSFKTTKTKKDIKFRFLIKNNSQHNNSNEKPHYNEYKKSSKIYQLKLTIIQTTILKMKNTFLKKK